MGSGVGLVDSPLGRSDKSRHHVQVYRSILSPMQQQFLGRCKPKSHVLTESMQSIHIGLSADIVWTVRG